MPIYLVFLYRGRYIKILQEPTPQSTFLERTILLRQQEAGAGNYYVLDFAKVSAKSVLCASCETDGSLGSLSRNSFPFRNACYYDALRARSG